MTHNFVKTLVKRSSTDRPRTFQKSSVLGLFRNEHPLVSNRFNDERRVEWQWQITARQLLLITDILKLTAAWMTALNSLQTHTICNSLPPALRMCIGLPLPAFTPSAITPRHTISSRRSNPLRVFLLRLSFGSRLTTMRACKLYLLT